MNDPADARDKLLLLTAALFAVRLFRYEDHSEISGTANAAPATIEKLEQWKQAARDRRASASAADAAAIMAAVSVVKL
jgi:hypothetical protein